MSNKNGTTKRLSRRDFLKAAGATGAALAIGNIDVNTGALSAVPTRAQTTVTMWSPFTANSDYGQGLAAMIERFNAENPDISIEHATFPHEEYKASILNTAFAADDPPDVFSSVGFEWLIQFVRTGSVLDLTEFHQTTLKDRYLPGIESTYQYEDKLWGIPWFIGATPFIYYNVDHLVGTLGFSPEDLETIDGMMGVCEAALAADMNPIAFGSKGGIIAVHWLSNFYKTIAGAEQATAMFTQQSGAWTDPEMVEAVNMLKTFYDTGYMGKNTANEDYSIAQEQFLNGDAVMIGTGGWVVGALAKQAEDPKFEFDFVQFPTIPGKPGRGSDWVFWGELLAAANTDLDPEIQLRILDAFGSAEYQVLCYELFPDTYAARGVVEAADVELHPLVEKKLTLYKDATALVPIPDVAMPVESSAVLYEEVMGVLLGMVSVEDALENIEESVQRAMESME